MLVLAALLAVWAPMHSVAQDDPNDVPLGDIARNLRKNNQPKKQVIDDDNLPQVMEQAESHPGAGSSLRYLMAGETKGFQVSAPDVTCSLAFTANVKALLSRSQYSQMDLPAADLAKLEGPAAIEGDALTVSVFNATNWHISEVEVALTLVKKAGAPDADAIIGGGTNDAASINSFQEVRPERKPDITVLYRMRAPAPPWNRAVFSAPLNLEIAPGDEWHWAIVQAKGYPPQGFAGPAATAQSTGQLQVQPAASVIPESLTTPIPQDQP